MNEQIGETARLLRETLGSINIEKTDEPKMDAEQRASFVAKCAGIFVDVLEEDLERLINAQGQHTAMVAETWEQILFGRGTLNGLLLVRELFQNRKKENEQVIKDAREDAKETIPDAVPTLKIDEL